MASQDISRYLLQPTKHYAGLHLQQGRVIVDSDWNERANIEAEELRQTLLDIVSAHGTPNDGFAIVVGEDPETIVETTASGSYSTYDFTVTGGSYYVAGLRLAIASDGEQFLSQSDWLQLSDSTADMPAQVLPGDGMTTRHDLVYVYAWEQPVTAVEDAELIEPALGGRDTSARIKRMRRFVVASDVDSDPAVAFANVISALEDGGKAQYNSETGELVSNARLQVQFDAVLANEDVCAEPTAGGYVGAENQTIRVELRPGGKLVWGFDNASKLFRVQVDQTTVSFLTVPEDISSMPRTGQVVEILPWGAELPNGEKVAEAQGFVTTVADGYSPVSRDLQLSDEIDETWNEWLEAHEPDEERRYLYLRVWDRGSELLQDSTDAEIVYGSDFPLGNTGLRINIAADGKPGDYWIIAARPSTPNAVTPWDLSDVNGVPPHGPRRVYAPLAQIAITNGAEVTYDVTDLRTPLRQLCDDVACTITVGDGWNSFGMVDSLQDAILLAGNGSKICLLPGVHGGTTTIEDFDGLVIEGCGERSVLANDPPTEVNTDFTAFESPVLEIQNCQNLTIRNLAIKAYSSVGVYVDQYFGTCKRIKLEGLTINCTGGYTSNSAGVPNSWWLPASGIVTTAVSEVEILDCTITMDNVLSFAFGVVLGGDSISMRRCRIEALTTGNVSGAFGGVNVRSGSRDVEIVDCTIDGGRGHGVALGHGRVYVDDEKPTREEVLREQPVLGAAEAAVPPGKQPNDCECEQGEVLSLTAKLVAAPKFFPAGAVENVRIYGNTIRNMGISGISTTLFWPAAINYGSGAGVPRFIVVTDIDIAGNLIEDNVKLPLPAALFINLDIAVGGVCLAASANAWIHENTVRNNGSQFVLTPVCGVGMLAAMNAVIEDNQIVDNGVRLPAASTLILQPGIRGGIMIREATSIRTRAKSAPADDEQMPSFPTGTADEVPPEGVKDWTGVSSQAAVTIRANEISQPVGKALGIRRGFGEIIVNGNSMLSYGDPVYGIWLPAAALGWGVLDSVVARAAGGSCVEIVNYARALDYPWGTEEVPELSWTDESGGVVDGGDVLMTGNSMRLSWDWVGGIAASVVISSLSSAVFDSNVSVLEMGNTYDPDAPQMTNFYADILVKSDIYALAMFNVYVGALSTVQVVGCRMTEPQFDCLFSAVLGPPLSPVYEWTVANAGATVLASNVGSHAMIGDSDGIKVPAGAGDPLYDNLNAVVFPHESFLWEGYEVYGGDADLRKVHVKHPPLV